MRRLGDLNSPPPASPANDASTTTLIPETRRKREELLYVIHAQEDSSSSFDNLSFEEEEEVVEAGDVTDRRRDALKKIVELRGPTPKETSPVEKMSVAPAASNDYYKKAPYVANGARQHQQQQQQQQQQQPQRHLTQSVTFKSQHSYYLDREVTPISSSSLSTSSSSSSCLCCPPAYDDGYGGLAAFRVVVIALCLCVVHAAGIMVALYLLVRLDSYV